MGCMFGASSFLLGALSFFLSLGLLVFLLPCWCFFCVGGVSFRSFAFVGDSLSPWCASLLAFLGGAFFVFRFEGFFLSRLARDFFFWVVGLRGLLFEVVSWGGDWFFCGCCWV